MRVQLLSDLHLEKRSYDKDWLRSLRQSRVDVTVFAGDVMHLRDKKRVAEMLGVMAEFSEHVIYTPGNHDHWGTSPLKAQGVLAEALLAFPNIHAFVEPWNTWTHTNGQRFVGGTMWYSREAVSKVAQPDVGLMIKSGNIFSDFHFVVGLTPWVYEQNKAFTAGLEADLCADDIVITHHLPTFQSVPDRYRNSSINAFFVHDVRPVIMDRQPRFWLNGHTHSASDYRVGKTRVLCNPVGDPGERERDGDPYKPLVLDIRK